MISTVFIFILESGWNLRHKVKKNPTNLISEELLMLAKIIRVKWIN